MPRICLSSKFPSRVNVWLDYTTQMTPHKATDELKNFLSPVPSFFKEPSKSRCGAIGARTDSVRLGHLCSKTASRVSRATPSSTGPFLSLQFRVLCGHKRGSMVVFSGEFAQVDPRQRVSTEVFKQGSQIAQALSFWKDVIMCLFMYTHVCMFV